MSPAPGLESSDSSSSSKDPPPLRVDKDQKNQVNAATAADVDPTGSTGPSALYKVSSKEKKYGKRIRRTAGQSCGDGGEGEGGEIHREKATSRPDLV